MKKTISDKWIALAMILATNAMVFWILWKWVMLA